MRDTDKIVDFIQSVRPGLPLDLVSAFLPQGVRGNPGAPVKALVAAVLKADAVAAEFRRPDPADTNPSPTMVSLVKGLWTQRRVR